MGCKLLGRVWVLGCTIVHSCHMELLDGLLTSQRTLLRTIWTWLTCCAFPYTLEECGMYKETPIPIGVIFGLYWDNGRQNERKKKRTLLTQIPSINKPPPYNRDYSRDPNIQALKIRGWLLIMGLR